jgi:predicted nucleic acid-binding protein
MKTAVDSSVLFDIVKGAPGAADAQAALEAALARGSLCVCAVVVAELGRYFTSNQDLQSFLADCQIKQTDGLLTADSGFFRHYFKALTVTSPTA